MLPPSQRILNAAQRNPIIDPAVIKEYAGEYPITSYSKSSTVIVDWKCPVCDHRWKQSFSSRSGTQGCAKCANKRWGESLALKAAQKNPITDPQLRKEYIGSSPLRNYSRGSNIKGKWCCSTCSHKWEASFNCRNKGKGCPKCSEKIRQKKFHLYTISNNPIVDAKLLREHIGEETLLNYSKMSAHQTQWKCSDCAHEWTASICNRSSGSKCPNCCKGAKDAAWKAISLQRSPITDSKLLSEYAGEGSLTQYSSGSDKIVPWMCSVCSYRWCASIGKRKRSGCPSCSPKGFDPNASAVIYFITDAELSVGKIGISNHPQERLTAHRKIGLNVVQDIWSMAYGYEARMIEKEILDIIHKKYNIPLGLTHGTGYSETFSIPEFSHFLNYDCREYITDYIGRRIEGL